ncbi:MAG TPA: DoxX family protein [Acidobacteriaceae bacterium]
MSQLLHTYRRVISAFPSLQSAMLLAVRLYWGFQFAQTGWGKLHNLPKITAFFASLNIPFPGINAPFVSTLEFAGGILFILGLFSRPIAFLLACNMIVAYWTADHEALVSIFSDPGKFYVADPYTFLFASLMVLIFGAGLYSVDTLVARYLNGRSTGCSGCGVLQNDKMTVRSSSLVRSIAAR